MLLLNLSGRTQIFRVDCRGDLVGTPGILSDLDRARSKRKGWAMRRGYVRFLDQGARQWIYKTACKNLWRVSTFYELDDLIQDGFMCFALCREKYSQRVENSKHFMSLLQTVFRNHITDLSNDRSNAKYLLPEISRIESELQGRPVQVFEYRREIPISSFNRPTPETTDQNLLEAFAGGEESEAEMITTLKNASEEIRGLLQAIYQTPKARVVMGSLRMTTNDKLNAVLGTVGMDFERQLKSLFGLDLGPEKKGLGFTYDGDLEEIKRAPAVISAVSEKQYGHRLVYKVERYSFRFVPSAA